MTVDSTVSVEQNLVQSLIHRAATAPDETAYHFISDLPGSHVKLTCANLLWESASLAVVLQEQELTGKPILLACRSNYAFVIGFYACLLAGGIAVPTAPPRREPLKQRIQFIARHAGVAAILTDSDSVMATGFAPDVPKIEIRQENDAAGRADPCLWEPAAILPDTPALIQYTSGTAADPHGILQTHGRLVRACAAVRHSFGHDARSVSMITLPLFHEIGLMYGVLEPMMSGIPAVLMTPAQFVQRPGRWLYLIQHYQVTTIGGPNFMFDILLRKVRPNHLRGVDLSSLRVCFCTGEQVRAATLARLLNLLEPVGLNEQALLPCYSLSEAGRHVTGLLGKQGPGMDQPGIAGISHPVMSCGKPHDDCRILVVDPVSRQQAAEAEVGEIWLQCDSAGLAYWNEPLVSEAVFGAFLENGDGPFIRTGDIAYLLSGELFVVGRLADRIRLCGAYHAPQDLELLAERSHPGLRPSSSAAFTVDGIERPKLVIVCEIRRELMRRSEKWPQIETAIRNAIKRVHLLPVDDIVLLASGTLPKTSSGKVRRNQCRTDYLDGTLHAAGACERRRRDGAEPARPSQH
ncbi:MAG: AMP-binding protein [Burkholderiaceae bacterium]